MEDPLRRIYVIMAADRGLEKQGVPQERRAAAIDLSLDLARQSCSADDSMAHRAELERDIAELEMERLMGLLHPERTLEG